MDKKTGIIIGVIVAVFVAIVGVSMVQNAGPQIDYNAIDTNALVEAGEATGGLAETVEGDPNAPVLIFEYGNYQCVACAPMNPKIAELVEEYDGQVAVVFRAVSLPDHDNGTASASAALAAAQQGYWKEYKDLLYANQSEWYYATGTERQILFDSYLDKVSDGQADLEQFHADMASKEVAQKLKLDDKLATRVGVEWTPFFVLDGETLKNRYMATTEFLDTLREKIDALLAKN